MWNTPDGDRKLVGAERRLFVIGLLRQLEYFVGDEDGVYELEVPILNQIPAGDRPYAFLQVAEDLLGDGAPPELRAWNEGIVYELFDEIGSLIDLELEDAGQPDNPYRFFFRQAILESGQEAGDNELPEIASQDPEVWKSEVDILSGGILHDHDCLDYEIFADLPAEPGEALKQTMGIKADYYTAAPPSFPKADRERLDAFHTSLTAEDRAWSKLFEETGRLGIPEAVEENP